MSIRYEIPEPEGMQAREAKQDAQWKTVAENATKDDPVFQRWKKRYWTGVRSATILVFCGVFFGALTLHLSLIREERERKTRFSDLPAEFRYHSRRYKGPWDPRLLSLYFYYPVGLAGATYGVGAWHYRRKLRSIAVRIWSEQRATEFESKRRSIPHVPH